MRAKEVLARTVQVLLERGWVRKRPGFEWAGMLARDGSAGCVCVEVVVWEGEGDGLE